MNRLDQIEARANAATPGPWQLLGDGEYVSGPGILVAPDDGGVTSADAEFIAAARTTVPDMAAALRAVLELHKEDGHGWGPGESFCTECQQGYGLLVPYPCPTVETIRRHLGDDQ